MTNSPRDYLRKRKSRERKKTELKRTRLAKRTREKKSRKVLYKIGGSLLDVPELFTRLKEVIRSRPMEKPLLVWGGGAAADLVREWDEKFDLSDEEAHLLAIRAMDMNAELAETKMSETAWAMNREDLNQIWEVRGVPLLDVETYLEQHEPYSELILPHTWECTSDSIAAWCAINLGFQELRFCKSVPAPEFGTIGKEESEALDPIVKEYLPRIPIVSWCNLRESTEVVTVLKN